MTGDEDPLIQSLARVPVPPGPVPGDVLFRVTVSHALEELERSDGAVSPQDCLLHIGVHAWLEGHLEGEERCPGCARDALGVPRDPERVDAWCAMAGMPAPDAAAVRPDPATAGPPMPAPPFPSPAQPILRALVGWAAGRLEDGAPLEEVAGHLAALAWMEGHIEGEDRCPGCTLGGNDVVPRGPGRPAAVARLLERGAPAE